MAPWLFISFQYPAAFWGLWALLPMMGLFRLAQWKKQKTFQQLGDKRLIEQLVGSLSPRNNLFKFILAVASFASIIFSAANFQLPGKNKDTKRTGRDLVIALDLSRSMLAEDVKPNRLERSRMLIRRLIETYPDDRIGLIVFAGHAYVQMPLSTDHTAALMYVQQAHPEQMFTQGTAINEALTMSDAAFMKHEKKYKAVVLISDGEEHDEETEQLLPGLKEKGVMVMTVGVGTIAGSSIKDPSTGLPKKEENGNTVQSKLNEQLLKKVAAVTGGAYIRLGDISEATQMIRSRLDQMEKYAFDDDTASDRESYFQLSLLLALLLLVLEFFWPETKFRHVPNKALLLLPMVLSCGLLKAQETENILREGDRHYQEKEYGKAIEKYRLAASRPEATSLASYNEGVCYYRMNDHSSAGTFFEAALKGGTGNATLQQRALYNTAVNLSRQNKLEESIGYYKRALLLDPGDKDCRFNLQKALEALRQKQKEQENKKKNEKNQPPPADPRSMEQWLKSLQQKEQEIQQKLPPKGRSSKQPDKDW